ncbi:rab3 GTPase-activating protein catalytic protein [Tasmannia lanceolata]|uniref:rab3 GTPase-activating protein catalytic protein n=1 Tax=Tasmannia lanceolata TaxID=3420 RepID=UPI0040638061
MAESNVLQSQRKTRQSMMNQLHRHEEKLEGFDDFTLASSWERFISEIEAVCRLWLADGPKNLLDKGADCLGSPNHLYKVKFELKCGTKCYCIEYYFEINSKDKVVEWNDDLHNLQLYFGVKEFLVIAPISASGVVLDAPEASKLLSAVAIALSNCGSTWPAFVPVHDPSRKAYIGIQNMGTLFTRRFEADHIGSQVPIRLMHLEGLYELFVSKFAFSTVDLSTNFFNVHFTMKLTYRTPPRNEDDDIQGGEFEVTEAEGNSESNTRNKTQWDDDCPWTEWYSAEDPVKGFELIAMWSSRSVESSLDMAELENASSHEAKKWLLLPMLTPNLNSDPKGNVVGFASQLRLLVSALELSFKAQFMEDFLSGENPGSENLKPSAATPPPTVVDRVLKDLFHEGELISNYAKAEQKNSRVIKGAPLESLFAQFCLHSLWFGNCHIRAIALLWIEFVREVRWCWEESQPLPRMLTNGVIDLSTCLIHQKLQMLALCIAKKLNNHHGSETPEEISSVKPENMVASEDVDPPNRLRRGSAGVVGSTMLLKSNQRLHAPYTQDAPIMTEDMHEERLHALEAFGNTFSFSAQLERDVLSLDMSAFKAANPEAIFEDFIRWHSPGDWEDDRTELNDKSRDQNDWPPRGKLSERMSGGGNSWRQIWNDSPPLAASEQKPLLDPNREGEKILHYLETLRPHNLLEQMVCTAFRASADSLNQTSFGDLKQMAMKVEQLYLTMASSLKPLQTNHLTEKGEFIDDLKRLCLVFEHIEKLLILAASIHRKLLHAPRLSKAIFGDYFDFYVPRMGTSSIGNGNEKEFNKRQAVTMSEREVVANMFTVPTANQSWRKVLSMGNLLNGHEPILREIIFTVNDSIYGARGYHQEIETHRMYICGTSNDLRVALSVTSCD